jgi:hypothetical protein
MALNPDEVSFAESWHGWDCRKPDTGWLWTNDWHYFS